MSLIGPSEIARLRRDAESLMVDTCTVERPGTPARTPTGGVTPGTPTTQTSRCWLEQRLRGVATTIGASGAVVEAVQWLAHLPATVALAGKDRLVVAGQRFEVLDPGAVSAYSVERVAVVVRAG